MVTTSQAWRALIALSLGFFMTLLDQSAVAVALPAIAEAFDVPVSATVWVSTAYLLALAGPLLTTGRLGDRFGYRRLFQIGTTVFALGALGSAVAPSLGWLVAARAVQGLGAAILMPQSMAVINRVFPREHRGRALGVWGVVGSVASLVGPVLGGLMVTHFGWYAIFAMHVPIGIIALIATAAWVPSLPTASVHIDITSAISAIVAVIFVISSIQFGFTSPWALLVGIVAVVVFLLRQRQAANPLVPPEMFRDRNFSAATAAIVMMGFVASSVMIPMMVWLQEVLGLDAATAGWVVSPMAVISLVLGPVVGVLADRMSPRTLSVIGFGTMIVALALVAYAVSAELGVWSGVLSASLLGIGQTFVWATNAATAMRDIAPEMMGAASGTYNTARQLGAAIGVAVVGAVLTASLVAAFLTLIVALAAGGLVSLRLQPTLRVSE